MEEGSRLKKSVINAQVNFFFFLASLLLSFFSRRTFLNCLGDDFVGLTGTVNSLMGFLNLAELGVGMAMAYVLYTPLFRQEKEKINELISVMGFLYRRIGLLILMAGLLLACFLPLIFAKTGFSAGILYFTYFTFLTSVLIGYFVNYHAILLNADQRTYVVVTYFQSSNIVKLLLQMALAWYTRNYYYWVMIELVFGITSALLLHWKIFQVYPWLQTDLRLGRKVFRKYPEITRYIRQVFVHRMSAFVLNRTDDLIIYAFVSLKMVAYYGNYALIVSKLSQMVDSLLGSVGSSVGNLIAEGNPESIRRIFWELTSVRYLIAGTVVFSVYHLIHPFVCLWLGEEYVLSHGILILLLVNFLLMQMRWSLDIFINGYGLFYDTWAPCTEALLNLGISIVFARLWGIQGVLFGTTVSMLLIVGGWKPYFLYRRGFKTPLSEYVLTVGKYLSLGGIAWAATVFLLGLHRHPVAATGFLSWILQAVMVTLVYGIFYYALLYVCARGMRNFTLRIWRSLRKKV